MGDDKIIARGKQPIGVTGLSSFDFKSSKIILPKDSKFELFFLNSSP